MIIFFTRKEIKELKRRIGETERIFKDEKIGGIKGTTPTISYLAVP